MAAAKASNCILENFVATLANGMSLQLPLEEVTPPHFCASLCLPPLLPSLPSPPQLWAELETGAERLERWSPVAQREAQCWGRDIQRLLLWLLRSLQHPWGSAERSANSRTATPCFMAHTFSKTRWCWTLAQAQGSSVCLLPRPGPAWSLGSSVSVALITWRRLWKLTS